MDVNNKEIIPKAYRRLGSLAAGLGGAQVPRVAGQEILDFLAMLDGLKPVLLVGRGLEDERWIAGVLGVARSLDLGIVEGCCWSARPPPAEAPGWYVEHVTRRLASGRAWYLTASEGVAEELRAVCAGAAPDIATEARLLGYPACCVAAHYDRANAWHRLTLNVLRRSAEGDEVAMRALLDANVAIEPESAAQRSLYAAATDFLPCPYASWNMCPACAGDPRGPSARFAARYRTLAEAVDPELAWLLDGQ